MDYIVLINQVSKNDDEGEIDIKEIKRIIY
jgi:hypothetical protein